VPLPFLFFHTPMVENAPYLIEYLFSPRSLTNTVFHLFTPGLYQRGFGLTSGRLLFLRRRLIFFPQTLRRFFFSISFFLILNASAVVKHVLFLFILLRCCFSSLCSFVVDPPFFFPVSDRLASFPLPEWQPFSPQRICGPPFPGRF